MKSGSVENDVNDGAWWKVQPAVDQEKCSGRRQQSSSTISIDKAFYQFFFKFWKYDFFLFFQILSYWGTFGINTCFRFSKQKYNRNSKFWKINAVDVRQRVNVHFYCVFHHAQTMARRWLEKDYYASDDMGNSSVNDDSGISLSLSLSLSLPCHHSHCHYLHWTVPFFT